MTLLPVVGSFVYMTTASGDANLYATKAEHAKLDQKVESMVTAVASLAHSVEKIHESVTAGFDRVYTRFETQNERTFSSGKTNWGWLISAVVLLIVFMKLVIDPMSQSINQHSTQLETEHQNELVRSELRGRYTALLEIHGVEIEKIEKRTIQNAIDAAATRETVKDLERWVGSVDRAGTRFLLNKTFDGTSVNGAN